MPASRRERVIRRRALPAAAAAVMCLGVMVTMGAAVAEPEDGAGHSLVVARASSLADVGVATSLMAAGHGGSLLLVEDALDAAASRLMSSINPDVVLIVGGRAAVTVSVVDGLRSLAPAATFERIDGTDRVHTAVLAAHRVLLQRGADGGAASGADIGAGSSVALVHGWASADVGVTASLVAGGLVDAVLYASAGGLGNENGALLRALRPELVLGVGGGSVLPDRVMTEALAASTPATTGWRLSGTTRVDTAALAARAANAAQGGCTSAVVIANSSRDGDIAMAAALVASLHGSRLLYPVYADVVGDQITAALRDFEAEQVVVVGGPEALRETVEGALRAANAPVSDVVRVLRHTDVTELVLNDRESGGDGLDQTTACDGRSTPDGNDRGASRAQVLAALAGAVPFSTTGAHEHPDDDMAACGEARDTSISVITGDGGFAVLDPVLDTNESVFWVNASRGTTTVTMAATAHRQGVRVSFRPADVDPSMGGHQVVLGEDPVDVTAVVRTAEGAVEATCVLRVVQASSTTPAVPSTFGGDIYLTFDDGPHPRWTPQVLDVLARHGARATFFVNGEHAAAHPALIDRMGTEGHSVANHTYFHERLDLLDRRRFSLTILRTQRVLDPLGSYCLRPPGLQILDHQVQWARELGFSVVGADFSTRDWTNPGADVIAERIVRDARRGRRIVLLHDGSQDRHQTVEGLALALQALEEGGSPHYGTLCRADQVSE